MAISEQARHEMHRKLEEVLGAEDAARLMSHLPPQGWADVATKVDLDHLAALTRRDIEISEGRLSAQFEGRFGALERRIDRIDAGLGARIDGLDARMDGLGHRFDEVDAKLATIGTGMAAQAEVSQRLAETMGRELGQLYKELAAHTRTTVYACLAAVMTAAGLAFAASL